MLEREENELLQDYRYRKNILQEITLDDIDRWNNMEADVDWDKITNKPSTFPPSTHTHNFEDLLEKPTTLEGYGITDVYTKDEIQDNTLNKFKAINGKVLVDTGFNLGLKDGDNLISYNYGTSGAPTLKLGVNAYISSYMSNMDIVAPTQLMLKTGNLNLKTKLLSLQGSYGSFSVDVSDNKGNNKLYASIPAEFTDIVKAPRLNIYSDKNTVLEGALWNSTYNINGEIKDGLHLSHENGKYLALAYKNASTGIYNSYMICDVEGVLRNDSDGDDWGPVRFEQNVFFRHGLKIGGGEDIILAGKGVNTRITALENAISQGTGMVEWNNVLNKPSTFIPSSHSHTIADVTGLQSALDGKAASNHTHSYLPLSGGNLTGDITAQAINVGNSCPIRGRETSNGLYKTLVYMNSQNQVVLGSGSNSVTIQIPALDKLAIWDDATKKSYNIYHSGNFNPSNYFSRSGKNTTNLNTCYDVGIYFYTDSTTGAPNRQYGHILNTVSDGNKYNGSNNWLSQLAFNTDDTIWHRSKVNSNEWTNWTKLVKTTDLNNYLPKSGGTLTGDIILSNSAAIKGNISGTAQDLIKFGTYATSSGSTQATIVGNSNYPTISLGSLYEGNYRVLNSNNFTSYCPSISDLDNYLNKSGGTMTGEIALAQDKGIISANAEGGTLLVETSSSVNVGKTTKNLNLNCSLAYMNGARVLTEYNYASYVLPKTIFAGLFSPDKTIGTDSNTFYGYSKKTVYKSADCTVGTGRITISKAGIYKVTATWGGVPKSGTANTSAMRFIIQQRNSSADIASKLDTITVTTLNRAAKSTISGLFKCSANDYFIIFSYLCTVTFESEDVEIEIVRIS